MRLRTQAEPQLLRPDGGQGRFRDRISPWMSSP